VDKFQTLITGILAVAAAAWTIQKMDKQIRQEKELELERRNRRNYAERTMMPLTLAALCDYSRQCVKWLVPLLSDPQRLLAQDFSSEPPNLPSEILFSLKENIEFEKCEVREVLADLVKNLQIQRSRLINLTTRPSSLEKTNNPQDYLRELVVDACGIYARSANLFEYARRKSDSDKMSRQLEKFDLIAAANDCSIRQNNYPEIFDLIEKRFAQQAPSARQS
jgi:hypothetical protein